MVRALKLILRGNYSGSGGSCECVGAGLVPYLAGLAWYHMVYSCSSVYDPGH